jgi:hypothetical protein
VILILYSQLVDRFIIEDFTVADFTVVLHRIGPRSVMTLPQSKHLRVRSPVRVRLQQQPGHRKVPRLPESLLSVGFDLLMAFALVVSLPNPHQVPIEAGWGSP